MSNRNKRKNYFVKKGFQSKLTVIILLIVVIVANLVGGIIYGILTGNEVTKYLADLFRVQTADLLLPVIILSEILAVCIVTMIGIFISHSMAGPVYRFEKVLRSMAEGELDCQFQLRSSDEFHEIEEGINGLIDVLTERFGAMNGLVNELENARDKKDLAALDSIITGMRTQLDHFKLNPVDHFQDDASDPDVGE